MQRVSGRAGGGGALEGARIQSVPPGAPTLPPDWEEHRKYPGLQNMNNMIIEEQPGRQHACPAHSHTLTECG